MAITNHERVGKALDLLKIGLSPFVEREFRNIYKDGASANIERLIGDDTYRALDSAETLSWHGDPGRHPRRA